MPLSEMVTRYADVSHHRGFASLPLFACLTQGIFVLQTTLLNYILHEDHGHRIAVVQNEFGEEIGLERAVTMGKGPQLVEIDDKGEEKPSALQEWLELPNGCICCTAKDNLVMALENLVQRKDKFDYIFVETTGMADPGPLAKTLWVDEELGSSIYLDAVVTLVDAKLIRYHLHGDTTGIPNDSFQPRKLEAMRQIALADVILINKVDLVEGEQQQKVKDELSNINALAEKYFTHRSRIDLSLLMGIRSFDGNKLHASLAHFEGASEHDHHSHGTHKHSAKTHADGVNTIVIKYEGDVKSVDVVSGWFADLLWEQKVPVYRIKGEVAVQHQDKRYIVQGVYDNFEILPTEYLWTEELPSATMVYGKSSSKPVPHSQRYNTLVLIGVNLDQKKLFTSFYDTCAVKKADVSAGDRSS